MKQVVFDLPSFTPMLSEDLLKPRILEILFIIEMFFMDKVDENIIFS